MSATILVIDDSAAAIDFDGCGNARHERLPSHTKIN